MLRVFRTDLYEPDKFVITLELVPGREAVGRTVDTVMGIAGDAFTDGRISAVSMTDNPGGNPALSPDVLGHEIFKLGMDVIVHFTCRDTNRVGMESRALQLAMMGMKNILALTGDYSGQGFGGQGAPVFDIDSVQLQILNSYLNDRIKEGGDPDEFLTGCAVSPFKYTPAESFSQYAKLCRKISAGAAFVITQLGYDAAKYMELLKMLRHLNLSLPVLGSVYLLTPGTARIMNKGKVPGAIVSDELLRQIETEWRDPSEGRKAAIERAAQTGAVLKGLGYKGIHIGGVHRRFDTVGAIVDRMAQYESQWEALLPQLCFSPSRGFYAFADQAVSPKYDGDVRTLKWSEKAMFTVMRYCHDIFFNRGHLMAPVLKRICETLDGSAVQQLILHLAEDPLKRMMLGCMKCGDCGIQHVGFLCPESGCPKHMRNGACGGSHKGRCEVYPERYCIWVRAYARLADAGKSGELMAGCVPPRMWELNHTSSWFNFHLRRDHQGASSAIAQRCRLRNCRL
jgi:methylenetetrahydrofolate reductase (NADPH)